MPSSSGIPVLPPSASPPGPPSTPPTSVPYSQPRFTPRHVSLAHDVVSDATADASGTRHQLPGMNVFSPEGDPVAASLLSTESVTQAVMPSESDPDPATADNTSDGRRASHTTVDSAALTSAHGASPVTDDDVDVATLAFAESTTMPSSASSQPSTKTRVRLANQRRPRSMPHQSSAAANNSCFLHLGYGIDSTVVSFSDTETLQELTPPPLLPLSTPSVNATASSAPGSLHSLRPTTPPKAAVAALPSATVLHLPSSITVTAALACVGSNAGTPRGSPGTPCISASSDTGTADDESGVPVTLEVSLAAELPSTAAPAFSSFNSNHTTRPGSPFTTNVPYRARIDRFSTEARSNVSLSVYWNANMASCYEPMPSNADVPLTNVAGSADGIGGGDGTEASGATPATVGECTVHRGGSVAMCPCCAAAGDSAGRTASDGTAGSRLRAMLTTTNVVSASPDYMDYLPSPPVSASRRPQLRPQQAPHGGGGSNSDSGANNTSSDPFATSWPWGGSEAVHCACAEVADGHVMPVVNDFPRFRLPEELAQSAPTEENDVPISPAAHGRKPWSALQSGLMVVGDDGVITGGVGSDAVVEAQRRAARGGGDGGVATALARAAAANAYKVYPTSDVLSGAQRSRSGEGDAHHISGAASRPVSSIPGGVDSSPAAQREASHGCACTPATATDEVSPVPGYRRSARVVLTAAYDPANRSISEASKSWAESRCGDAAVTPRVPPAGVMALCNPRRAFRAHHYHPVTTAPWSKHGAVLAVNLQHQHQRPPVVWSKSASDAAAERGNGDERSQDRQRQTRHKEQQVYAGEPARQRDGATVVSSLRRFLSAIPIPSPPNQQQQQQQQRGGVGNSDRASLFQQLQSTFLPSSSPPPAAATLPSPKPSALPTFALFGALERLSRFSEMVQLCHEHADVLDDFLARLTLQLHRSSCAPALLLSGASAAPSQSSLPPPPSLTMSAAHDDGEFLRWHRIVMFLLRQPSELAKVGVEFFSDAVNSWPLHMLYLTCCFYVTAREHGFDALATTLSKGGIFCSGKGLFAALAVSMAQNEEDLIRSTACMYRAAFYTGVLMRKRHQHFETETRLTVNGGFTLLVVNIPIITLRRLVARVNEGYDVFASMRDVYKESEAERGNTWFNVNSHNTAVSADTAPSLLGRRGGRSYSPTSSSGYASASSPFAPSMPHYPHSVIEVSRVISSRTAVLCGHPLDMLRLDTILARFADFNDVKIHREYLPSGGPENSCFFNKHMAHELTGLWKARGVSFSLASVQLPLYSPVNGDLWTESLRVPVDPPAPPDASVTTVASACDSNAIFCAAAPPPTEGYRDEWWMFNVAEAATCANQDLTYSLRHMRDGSALLDFSTHAIRIGRLIAWTSKSITVLAAPENRQESSAMPPPRRSPKEKVIRNTMEKLAIINSVLREVSDRIDQPPDALANPSVELFTTFTELGLLGVLKGPRERPGVSHFGEPTHAASVILNERQRSHHGYYNTGACDAPSGAAVTSGAPSTSRLGAAGSSGTLNGVLSSNGPAAGRRMRPNVGALVSLNSVSPSNANTGILTTASNLNKLGAIGKRHTNSLSLSSAGGVGGSSGLSAPSFHTGSAAGGISSGVLAAFRSRHASTVDGNPVTGADPGPHVEVGGTAVVSKNSFPECHSTSPLLSAYALTSNSPGQSPTPQLTSSSSPEAVGEARLLPSALMYRGMRRGSSHVTGAAHLLLDRRMTTMTSPYRIPSSVSANNTGATAAGLEARTKSPSATYTAERDGSPVSHVRSHLCEADAHEGMAATIPAGAVVGGLGGELWHTVSLISQSDASNRQRTPTATTISIGAVASLQPKTKETSVVRGVSLSPLPASFLSVPQEAHSRPSSFSPGRGCNSAVVTSDSLHEAPVSAFSFPSDGLAQQMSELELTSEHRILSVPSGRRSSHLLASGIASSRRERGIQYEAPVEGDRLNNGRDGVIAFDDDSAAVRRVPDDTLTPGSECFPLSMYENDLVIHRNNDYAGIVNVYQVSALITYYEMQFNCVLCDGAVLFAGLLKRASGIAFPSYTLLLCPTVFSLLELWDGYEFEEVWRRSLGAPVCSRVTSPISAGLV
ncbi:hypothetical_protein (plasmid) [Leishmania braziliensis MHOM/BR/75/M2904]|nr:hypothetical_protein [Leishmania braziliensis MHOM/BR/75/M2904]